MTFVLLFHLSTVLWIVVERGPVVLIILIIHKNDIAKAYLYGIQFFLNSPFGRFMLIEAFHPQHQQVSSEHY